MLHLFSEHNPNRLIPDSGDIIELGGIGVFVISSIGSLDAFIASFAYGVSQDAMNRGLEELSAYGVFAVGGLMLAANSRNIQEKLNTKLGLSVNRVR